MRFADPYSIKEAKPRDTILFAAAQTPGIDRVQQDYVLNFNDECFVLCDGLDGTSFGDVAAKLASETAIWGYRHIRQHPYYFSDKRSFLKRIFRSTNLAVWQKRREPGFEAGLGTTLLVVMIGAKNFWIGNAGNSSAWFYSDHGIKKLTIDDVDKHGVMTKAVGFARLGLVPRISTGKLLKGDMLVLMTAGASDYLTEKDMHVYLDQSGETATSAQDAASGLVRAAAANGSEDNASVVLIKRIGS